MTVVWKPVITKMKMASQMNQERWEREWENGVYIGRSTAWGLISHSLRRVESIEDF